VSAPTPSPARVPIEDGFFTIPDDPAEEPRLLGSRCRACGEVFFPRRVVCAKCLAHGTDHVVLGPRGRLWTFTWCHLPLFGSRRTDGGYGVGQVDLPEGPRIQSVLAGRREEFAIGMELVLDLETLGQTKDGADFVIFRFRPYDEARDSARSDPPRFPRSEPQASGEVS
jgi:uncharacterized OB-fold protein